MGSRTAPLFRGHQLSAVGAGGRRGEFLRNVCFSKELALELGNQIGVTSVQTSYECVHEE